VSACSAEHTPPPDGQQRSNPAGAATAPAAEPTTESAASSLPEDLWFVGGTLHKATCREWLDSTPQNRLATAGDFVAAILNPATFMELRAPAEEMAKCITKAAPAAPSKRVSEIGLKCLESLGWGR
jgi:hypothetical protein